MQQVGSGLVYSEPKPKVDCLAEVVGGAGLLDETLNRLSRLAWIH